MAKKTLDYKTLLWLAASAAAVGLFAKGSHAQSTGDAGSQDIPGGGGTFPDYRGTTGGTWAIINNNPQNLIKTGIRWKGKTTTPATPGNFEQFQNMYYGWLAAIKNLDAQIPYTNGSLDAVLKRLHLGNLQDTTAAQQARAWIASEMRNGGADTSAILEPKGIAVPTYQYYWLLHRNNARLEAGTQFTNLIDASKNAFTAAWNDWINNRV